jgi:hypothetical protein
MRMGRIYNYEADGAYGDADEQPEANEPSRSRVVRALTGEWRRATVAGGGQGGLLARVATFLGEVLILTVDAVDLAWSPLPKRH